MEAQLSTSQQNTTQEVQVGKAVPLILLLMIFSLVIDNSFKIISPKLVEYFHVSASTVAWQVTLAGLGATETLYLIFVARYVAPDKQKKYYGFSTSSFQIATVIGTLTGGFITTHLAWQTLFLVPLLSLLVIPFLLKYLPKESGEKKYIDVMGIMLVAAVAVTAMVYLTNFSWIVLIGFILATIVFLLYISNANCKLKLATI